MAQEQEVKKEQKKKPVFEPGKVFGLGAQFELGSIPDPKASQSLEDVAREAEKKAMDAQINEMSALYRARKGEGGDRSRVYGIL
ncbi:MAG: hypothetical protein HY438_01415 [DPANN group archaeon]|nr:hypothetical protein [DPANN group archaeon]